MFEVTKDVRADERFDGVHDGGVVDELVGPVEEEMARAALGAIHGVSLHLLDPLELPAQARGLHRPEHVDGAQAASVTGEKGASR